MGGGRGAGGRSDMNILTFLTILTRAYAYMRGAELGVGGKKISTCTRLPSSNTVDTVELEERVTKNKSLTEEKKMNE